MRLIQIRLRDVPSVLVLGFGRDTEDGDVLDFVLYLAEILACYGLFGVKP